MLFIVSCLEPSELLSSPLVQVCAEGVGEGLVAFPHAHMGGVNRVREGLTALVLAPQGTYIQSSVCP